MHDHFKKGFFNLNTRTGSLFIVFLSMLHATAFAIVLNNPYPKQVQSEKIYYSSFAEQPKTLDPARSYASNEYQFIGQIYEPLLQYDYYKRPYTLIPLTASAMPTVTYLNKDRKPAQSDKDIAYTVYTLAIREGIRFQPHPAFARTRSGKPLYLNLSPDYIKSKAIHTLADFKETGTREVAVEDYLYQIKRLANPAVNSPIYGLMSLHIEGFKEFKDQLPKNGFVDLRQYPLKGLKKLDKTHFEITVKGQYAQFNYWLAMPFFSPIPWEADKFYSQAGMREHNLTFNWYPVGTGPFMLTENNPNRRMTLEKNPMFRKEYFPDSKNPADIAQGYNHFAGQPLPLIDKAIFLLEKETIPRWNKFLQGYYDASLISNESFDQAVRITPSGIPILTHELKAKKMRLIQTSDPAIFYFGFNMLDAVIGGRSESARKLRLAISLALDFEEQIAIFLNGRGQAAQGPVPPGIFGYRDGKAGINPYLYFWDDKAARPGRHSLQKARQLLAEAGYPDGIDPATRKPLILYYDTAISGSPDDKALLDWMRKQFAKLHIDLNIRGTTYNRFQDKIRSGNAQLFSWGWSADYPDPENFLSMFYSKNGMATQGGENTTNYANPRFDALFESLKNRPNDAERASLIDASVDLLRHDAPWAFGILPNSLTLAQNWVYPAKPDTLGHNTLKYVGLDIEKRNQLRDHWNQAILWPLWVIAGSFMLLCIPVIKMYWRKEKAPAARIR